MSSFYLVGLAQAAKADAARVGLVVNYLRDVDRDAAAEPLRGGLPQLTTIEVTPDEIGPNAVKLDQASRAKLASTEEEEDRIARGETVTFLVGG